MTGKRGSSRRRGDDYQDLTALRFVLENYLDRKPFKIFLEYEKSGNLDDIVVFNELDVIAYQVKFAVNPLAVYVLNDFLDPKSPVSIKKFADSWKTLKERFPEHNLTASLCSNRGLDADLVDIVTPDGKFTPQFIENRKRGDAKRIRDYLFSTSGLDADAFTTFLSEFSFSLRQPPLSDLEQHIRTVLLDKKLGLSGNTIFFDLRDFIKNNAIYSRDAITQNSIDQLLEKVRSKLLIPQVFPVNHDHFVEQKSLSEQLDHALPLVNGRYLIITGLPGSGKSTSLTTFFEGLDNKAIEVFSYYCFVGVTDNTQRIRVQAESLRANLLEAFHRQYPEILDRRYDYSERNFLETLAVLAKYFEKQNRRLVILLDGLDHAERLSSEIRQTVITALPVDIPQGITIVVGTQELHKWPYFLKQERECPDSHIQMPLFSEEETEDYLCNKRKIHDLSHADIVEIHKKCEGLPLYLQYAAETLIASDSTEEALASLSPAAGGDIRRYYGLLWEEFDNAGMGNARHLCAVIACLRFNVHRDELYAIQGELSRPDFEDSFKCISHLLRFTDGRLSIFHNSFREFVIDQIPEDWLKDIRSKIALFLQKRKDSSRWFRYVFEYSYEAEDYSYILNEINTEFVNRALFHCRPTEEILDAIHWAVESAFKSNDIVQLSRLGSLKFRTTERLEENLDRSLLAKALLALGRDQDVMTFSYSSDGNRWIVDRHTALAVMFDMAQSGKQKLGKKLFDVFTDEFRGVDSNSDSKSQIIAIAKCLGIYLEKLDRPLRWLSQFRLKPDILEQTDPFAPGYAPHLAAYIDSLVQFGCEKQWTRLKRVYQLFPNNLVRYLLMRSFTRFNRIQELRLAVSEYVEQESTSGNGELAYFAARAGMPVPVVTTIAGTIKAPDTKTPDYIARSDPQLKQNLYSFITVGYEANNGVYEHLLTLFGAPPSLWKSALQHLLKAGYCIGQSLNPGEHDWYDDACGSISILVQAKQGEGERIFESIDLLRDILPFSIGLLTECVEKNYPERITDWSRELESLRDSLLWTTHFGISETIQDYDFELKIWEELAQSPAMRSGLKHILKSCAVTFEESTKLKGGCRSNHFIWLSAIMAKCGMREDAERWLQYGIRSSLIYGYHKDITLLHLIDVLKLINKHQPGLALERCSRMLSMVDWMPHLTDERETKWFPQKAFDAVLDVSRRAAFDLLRHFFHSTARWQTLDCLETYLLGAKDGDPEYLWCLSELFVNHFSEDGRHSKQFMGARKHIVDLAQQYCSEDDFQDFANRYQQFVLTNISPRHWPDDLKEQYGHKDKQPEEKKESHDASKRTFVLDGDTITRTELFERCQVSFTNFLSILDRVKKQNKHFYERDIVDNILRHHISTAAEIDDLFSIKKYVESQDQWQNSSTVHFLAKRFLELGDHDNAVSCFGIAYTSYADWHRRRQSIEHLSALAALDQEAAEHIVLQKCYGSASGTGGGFDTPAIAARGLEVLEEPHLLEKVFSDFLEHCEAMFAQLPQTGNYEWLKNYTEPLEDENHLILDLVIDELETPELDHGERLVKALTRLFFKRPETTVPILIDRLLTASGIIQSRLLAELHCIAEYIPEVLVAHQEAIASLLNKNNFLFRQLILKVLDLVAKHSPLKKEVIEAIQKIKRTFSKNIFHSTFRLPSRPSSEFATFLRKATLFDFPLQIRELETILNVPENTLIAAIEQKLHDQGWNIDEEREQVKDDWRGHVHPQGWPAVWIMTRFQQQATEALWDILNESAEKFRLNNQQVDRLWRTVQIVDPEYVTNGLVSRPKDILPLYVSDKNTWFAELDNIDPMEIATSNKQNGGAEWITVFERRMLAQEEKYNVPYRQEIFLTSYLIPQQVYGGAHVLDEIGATIERIAIPDSEGAITLSQARSMLTGRVDSFRAGNNDEVIPLIAVHDNPATFIGYPTVCSLASFIISQFDLSFTDFNLERDNQIVAVYGAWQEGYQDEAYTRDKLSFGVRLRVKRSLLEDVCQKYKTILCRRIAEKREHFKHTHKKSPTEKNESRQYTLFHL